MRIAQISTLSSPVGRTARGSVEKLVWNLSRHLIALGHEVEVFGVPGDSEEVPVRGVLSSPYAEGDSPGNWTMCEWMNIGEAIKNAPHFDIIHSHSYLHALPLTQVCKTPILSTLHVWPYLDDAKLLKSYPKAHVSALSFAQWSELTIPYPLPVVISGVEVDEFSISDTQGNYLLYLGRFIPQKGVVEAIELAKKLETKVLLCGYENEYFKTTVSPLLREGECEFIGPVNPAQRASILSQARALLYPLQAPEPFGLVLVESMMCGTPVIALSTGAVPEIVVNGVTGVIGDSIEKLALRGSEAFSLDRSVIARHARQFYSAETMAKGYLELYSGILGREEG